MFDAISITAWNMSRLATGTKILFIQEQNSSTSFLNIYRTSLLCCHFIIIVIRFYFNVC